MEFFDRTKVYIAILLAVFAAVVWVLVLFTMPVSKDTKQISITVNRGASARQVAGVLKNAGLIRSTSMFVIACRVTGQGNKLKPGVYGLSESMSVQKIIETMVSGRTVEARITIPEGYTIRQIADLLVERQLVDGDAFVRSALTQGYRYPRAPFVFGHNLEGYLFPDTYIFRRGIDIDSVVNSMLRNFNRKVLSEYGTEIKQVGSQKFGLKETDLKESLYKVLTVASLVEREARVAKDRPIIAAVIWNRLKKNMRLEIDATVSYVPGVSRDNKSKVYISDTNNTSSYNTYRVLGLPPTPICNPGLASIKAVLNPAEVDYLYYVAKPDGSHAFSRTYQQHLAAKRAMEKLRK